jgi:acyl carrier protein
MSRDEIRTALFKAINRVAPEADLEQVAPDLELRDQIDIDSFDFLTIMIALHESTGIDIPESDYSKLATLDDAIDYLETASR